MNLLRSIPLFLALALPGWGALPNDAIKAHQSKAPEVHDLLVSKVTKKAVKHRGDHSWDIVVEATLLKTHRSGGKLAKGDHIKITYRIPNMKKSPAVGDWASVVKKGAKYKAFLRLDNEKKSQFRPAAYSGTFELLK